MRLAITGGTGFVGGHLIRLAAAQGHEVRALARRATPPVAGVTWVAGALDRSESLVTLMEGVDAVVHVAGVVNAPDRAGFIAGNIAGTEAMVAAAKAGGIARFVHVSSLSAREPVLSDYGWSKAGAEEVVSTSGLDWAMVRPPAIYGPGDTEMLELFRMAKRGLVALPPGGRVSMLHVADLARLLLALALAPTRGEGAHRLVVEPDDGVIDGWDHRAVARMIGAAVGRRVVPLPVPSTLLRVGALLDGLVRGPRAKLTADRVRYFRHPDWVVRGRPPGTLWRPEISTAEGLRMTADWYRAEGWL